MKLPGPYDHAIGHPDSRYAVNTPALILDLDALERNVARMAATMASLGRALRPHAKSHKCSRIAQLQIGAGAVGICCATLDEAEVMAACGLRGILITSPVTTRDKIDRLMALVACAPDTMIVVDNARNVEALSQAAQSSGVVLPVLIDIDLGFGRTGVLTHDAVEELARRMLVSRGTRFAGLQAYGGHLQHIPEYSVRCEQARAAAAFVAGAVERLRACGISVPLISGGGTGTHAIDGQAGPFTEIQAGSYIFMDADYNAVAYDTEHSWPFEVSLFVQTAVTSSNVAGTVTVDAGTKALALNGPRPQVATASLAGSTYEFSGDEHGRIKLAAHCETPLLGERIELVVSHCDPTVAHYDLYHCVRGNTLVAVWAIDARGRRGPLPTAAGC
jgi:D-serine deaminase-like pyridoxal phosphate-dependent protein